MIEVKLGVILETSPALREISGLELPIRAALKWNRAVKEIDEVLSMFNDRRQKLFDEYSADEEQPLPEGAAEDAQPEVKKIIPQEAMEEFSEKIQALIDEEVEINTKKIRAESFGDVKMKPATLGQLDWILE